MQKIRTNEDELFKKLITRKAEFVKNIGQEKVDRFISGIYFAKLFPYACGTTPYDGNLMVDLALELHKCNLPDTNGVFALYNITKYRGEKKYDKMIEAMRAGIPGCHKELAMNLDVCLGDIKGLPNQERDLLIGYLKERSKDLQRPPLSYYEQAISNLENREGVQFQDLIYEEALKKAGKEGKMVFMDCYTVWCGPCKMMNERVFTQKVVGDYFKKHFIPLKVVMVKNIVKGKHIFARKAKPATETDKQVVTDLIDTLRANREICVGMAANMIGVNKSIIVVAAGPFQFAMVNPVITKKSGEYKTEEGCLSLDGVRPCIRYEEIEVDYLDSNFKPQHGKYSGFTAQIIQHEVDHCNGVVI